MLDSDGEYSVTVLSVDLEDFIKVGGKALPDAELSDLLGGTLDEGLEPMRHKVLHNDTHSLELRREIESSNKS